MSDLESRPTMRDGPAVALVLAGAWLAASPWLAGYRDSPALWNSVVTGAAIVALALVRLVRQVRVPSVDWLVAVLGTWAIAAPWALGYGDRLVTWSSVATGVVAAVIGVLSAVRADPPSTDARDARASRAGHARSARGATVSWGAKPHAEYEDGYHQRQSPAAGPEDPPKDQPRRRTG